MSIRYIVNKDIEVKNLKAGDELIELYNKDRQCYSLYCNDDYICDVGSIFEKYNVDKHNDGNSYMSLPEYMWKQ